MFYSERMRRREIAEREAAGDSVWSTDIPSALRVKLHNLGDDYTAEVNDLPGPSYNRKTIFETAKKLLSSDLGVSPLHAGGYPHDDFIGYLTHCESEDFPNVLEAMYAAIDDMDRLARAKPLRTQFEEQANLLLEDYRIAYSMVDGEVIPFTSREIHMEVTLPVLKLLSNPAWIKVEASYQDALRAVADKPADAVTDATTALQDGLKLMGCKGKDLKALLISAKKTLLNDEDEKLVDAIDYLIKWSSAARVNDGKVHTRPSTQKTRAWLVLHMIGILLLYLSNLDND